MPTQSQAAIWLKNVYLNNKNIEQYNKNMLLYNLLRKGSEFVKGGGLEVEWPMMDQRNAGGGAIDPTTMNLVPPGSHGGADANDTLSIVAWGIFLDSILFESAVSDEQAFFNVADMEMTKVFDDMKNGESRMAWGNGSAVIGTIASIGSVVSGLYPITLAGGVTSFFPTTLFFQVGGLITFLSSAYAPIANQAGITIQQVDNVNGIIWVSSVAALAAGNVITPYLGNTQGSSTGNEPIGFTGIFGNNSTLFGINPATNPLWNPALIDANNTDPTEVAFSYARTYMQLSNVQPKYAITHPLSVEKYAAGVLSTRRTVNTQEYDGGIETTEDYNVMEGPSIYGIGKLLGDPNTPMGSSPNTAQMILLDPDMLFIQQLGDISWLDEDGKTLQFLTAGASVASPSIMRYVGYIKHYWSIGCFKRKGGALFTNVNMLQN